MDLLPFQAGADASSEEEEDYLDINFDGELIDGVKLELTEDVDCNDTTDDRRSSAHFTYDANTETPVCLPTAG